jgi:drug/metabolite transporter (DMT)-like permease
VYQDRWRITVRTALAARLHDDQKLSLSEETAGQQLTYGGVTSVSDIRKALRYVSASALLFIGLSLQNIGGLYIRQDGLSPGGPLVGGILAILAVEIEALCYFLVRQLRFEAPFRAALFLLWGLPTIFLLGPLAIWPFLPKSPYGLRAINFTAPQAVACGVIGAVCALNLIYLYRRAGSGWKAKPR